MRPEAASSVRLTWGFHNASHGVLLSEKERLPHARSLADQAQHADADHASQNVRVQTSFSTEISVKRVAIDRAAAKKNLRTQKILAKPILPLHNEATL
jgi:hypothetical protein